ncbi:uncharacterized protein BYT42DRAFT_588315 [Radiomyces spectabilis]|uniref:uncharacterized protein n=1 Tax=Radiomyces spectabilis TaxID=64574 RepID=UPI0022203116|nr:uncharacterized protein BYT42DRAFT_588315 [Radiomyces spectabilis]KAI8365940.1 hypothetical protein BYT42DRAFT_588315 [Radiomyces spectabilis]
MNSEFSQIFGLRGGTIIYNLNMIGYTYFVRSRSLSLWRQCRRFQVSAAAGSKGGGGPKEEKVRAIPFRHHVKAAEKTFEQYHGHGFFSVRVSSAGPPEEIFLPFWVASATVHTEVVQAQIGRNVMRTRMNPSTRRKETVWETDWAWVPAGQQFTRDYIPLGHPGLQIYASHKYRRGFVNGMCTGQALEDTTKFSYELLDRPSYRELDRAYQTINRKVDPFTIFPTTALRLATSYIKSQEETYVDEYLKKTYAADQTRFLKLNVTLENVKLSPVYYPAYIYTVHYLGRNLRTFINGNDLTVGGLKVYNWERVAAVSALGMAGVMTATGGVGWGGMSGSLWLGIVLPTVVTSLFTMYYPLLSLRVRDWMRQREIARQAHDPHMWDTDWTAAYDAFEDEKRYRTWRAESEYSRSSQSAAGTQDPKGYYRALGIDRQATTADIQAAFRGLAMKHHPDRYADAGEKAKATERFQLISAAYSVLRDPKKRKRYDQTGQS